jgi:hypothetical protein
VKLQTDLGWETVIINHTIIILQDVKLGVLYMRTNLFEH